MWHLVVYRIVALNVPYKPPKLYTLFPNCSSLFSPFFPLVPGSRAQLYGLVCACNSSCTCTVLWAARARHVGMTSHQLRDIACNWRASIMLKYIIGYQRILEVYRLLLVLVQGFRARFRSLLRLIFIWAFSGYLFYIYFRDFTLLNVLMGPIWFKSHIFSN